MEPLVIAFDGDCLMCSRTIRWLAARDPGERLRFTPLQGERGAAIRERFGGEPPDSMLVESGEEVHARSDAALAIASALPQPWRALGAAARVVPRPLRDSVYDFIAARRHRWFGRGDACALPGPELEKRLL